MVVVVVIVVWEPRGEGGNPEGGREPRGRAEWGWGRKSSEDQVTSDLCIAQYLRHA